MNLKEMLSYQQTSLRIKRFTPTEKYLAELETSWSKVNFEFDRVVSMEKNTTFTWSFWCLIEQKVKMIHKFILIYNGWVVIRRKKF